MSEEELKSTLKYLKNKNNTRRIKAITINEAHKVIEEIERLNRENEELKKIQCTFLGTGCKAEIERLNNIIDKAIEYLKDNACYNDMGNFNDDLDYDKCGDLLDILKGSDKE